MIRQSIESLLSIASDKRTKRKLAVRYNYRVLGLRSTQNTITEKNVRKHLFGRKDRMDGNNIVILVYFDSQNYNLLN